MLKSVSLSIEKETIDKYDLYVATRNLQYKTVAGTALIEWFVEAAIPEIPELQTARNGHEIKDALNRRLMKYKRKVKAGNSNR